jgi:hypothetical protein
VLGVAAVGSKRPLLRCTAHPPARRSSLCMPPAVGCNVPPPQAGSTNGAYSPAWQANAASPSDAANELEQAVLASVPDSAILQQVALPSGAQYRAFSAPG